MVNVPFLSSGCRNYSNRRKVGNVCQSPRAQAGTGRLLLMMARSVTSSSHTVPCKGVYPLGIFCFVVLTTCGAGRGGGQSRARVQHPDSLVDKAVLQSADPVPQALHSPS